MNTCYLRDAPYKLKSPNLDLQHKRGRLMRRTVSHKVQKDLRRNRRRRIPSNKHNNAHTAKANRNKDRKNRVDPVDIRRHNATSQLELLPHETGHTDLGQLRQRHSILAQVQSNIEWHRLHQDSVSGQAYNMLHRGQRGNFDVALLPTQYLRFAQAIPFQRRICPHA